MLSVQHLGFSYGKRPVFSDISFSTTEGELCGLFGPNGSGKTTLFKCCLGLLPLQAGSVHIHGKDIRTLSLRDLARLASYVPQEHRPPFPYSVQEVVLMGRTPHMGGIFGISAKDRKITRNVIDLLGLDEIADRPYNELSSGQRQLVLIARAIAQETRIMFLDEPTSALDFSNQVHIWALMRSIVESGTTILACSHDPNHVAWFCDRVVVMDDAGSIVANGTPAEVISDAVLDTIYPDTCAVKRVDRVQMVLPRQIAEQNRF